MNEAERPPVAVGHVTLRVSDVARSAAFFRALGLRSVLERDSMAILELRGGTHLLLFKARRPLRATRIRSFDLMVDDVAQWRERLESLGLAVGALERDELGGHLWFEVADPDGRPLAIYSSHTSGRPV